MRSIFAERGAGKVSVADVSCRQTESPATAWSGRDSPGVGMRVGNGSAGLAQVFEVCGERLGHSRLDLLAGLPEREDTFNVGAMRAPGAVVGLLVDD